MACYLKQGSPGFTQVHLNSPSSLGESVGYNEPLLYLVPVQGHRMVLGSILQNPATLCQVNANVRKVQSCREFL